MKKQITKFFDKIIIVLLGILGIVTSCCVVCMYGEPVAEYEIKGVVTDKTSTSPIKNIRIIKQLYDNSSDTLYTDSQGKYVFNFGEQYVFGAPIHLKIDDIDGEENGGSFASQEIEVIFTNDDLTRKPKRNNDSKKYVKIQNIELEKE